MKKFKLDTIIVSKETWFFLQHYDRTSRGFNDCKDEWLERVWDKAFRNGGADPKTHPIDDNEIRIDLYTFGRPLDKVKTIITDNGFSYRDDGFIVEGFDI